MTHASLPEDVRAGLGIGDGLVRLSVGIEDVEDLHRRAEVRAGLASSSSPAQSLSRSSPARSTTCSRCPAARTTERSTFTTRRSAACRAAARARRSARGERAQHRPRAAGALHRHAARLLEGTGLPERRPDGAQHRRPAAGAIVVGAHYDTVPGSPGADDNASAVAALIELARMEPAGRFVAFANEEMPYFHERRDGQPGLRRRAPRARREDRAMLSLEMLGYYRDEPGSQRYPPPLAPGSIPTGATSSPSSATSAARALVRRAIGALPQARDVSVARARRAGLRSRA